MDPESSESLEAYRFVNSGELCQYGEERKSNQETANRDNKNYYFLMKSWFRVGQCAIGFMCIISLNLHDNIMREQIIPILQVTKLRIGELDHKVVCGRAS